MGQTQQVLTTTQAQRSTGPQEPKSRDPNPFLHKCVRNHRGGWLVAGWLLVLLPAPGAAAECWETPDLPLGPAVALQPGSIRSRQQSPGPRGRIPADAEGHQVGRTLSQPLTRPPGRFWCLREVCLRLSQLHQQLQTIQQKQFSKWRKVLIQLKQKVCTFRSGV